MTKYMSLFKREKGSMDGVVTRAKSAEKKELVKPKARRVIPVVAVPPVTTSRIAVVDAPADHCFWVYQGGALRNLRDLVDALKIMSAFQERHGMTQAVRVARAAFETHGGMWAGAPVTFRRFAASNDLFFSQPIAASLLP